MEEERQRKGDNHEEKGAVYFSSKKDIMYFLKSTTTYLIFVQILVLKVYYFLNFYSLKMILMIFLFQLAEYTQAEEKLRKTLLDLQKREKQLAVNEQEVMC